MIWFLGCAPPAVLPATIATTAPVTTPTGDCPYDLPTGPAAGPPRTVNVRVVPDVTGDSLRDALFEVWDVAAEVAADQLVASPLRGRAITLPDDAVAEVLYLQSSSGVTDVGDLDGDGLADLLASSGDYCGQTSHAVFSPVAGRVDVAAQPLFDGRALDLEGDGTLEQVRITGPTTVEIHAAGETGWAAAPILTIAPSCRWPDQPTGYATSYDVPKLGLTEVHPDLDGDGVREIRFTGLENDGTPQPCSWFVFPADVTGVFDPMTDPRAVSGIGELAPVGDVSGDGLTDLKEDGILVGPFTLSDGVLQPSDQFDLAAVPLRGPIGIDLDGDGLSEWDAEDSSGVTVYTGGPTGGITTGAALLSIPLADRRGTAWVVEDGVAALIVVDDAGLVDVIDVAPGTLIGP